MFRSQGVDFSADELVNAALEGGIEVSVVGHQDVETGGGVVWTGGGKETGKILLRCVG